MDYYPAKTIIEEILLDYTNIRQYYDPQEDEDYPHELFNNNEDLVKTNYKKFKEYAEKCNANIYECLFRMLPDVFDYAEYVGHQGHQVQRVARYLQRGNHRAVFALYALSVAEEIMDEYRDDILNLYFIPRKLAIKKLMRNRIVNEGILLKLSMKNCGMF